MTAITISRNPENVTPGANERLIIVRFKNPARAAAIAIPSEPWSTMRAEVPEAYAGLLDAVLEKAAKDILSATLSSFTTWPSEIGADRFTLDALMEQASGSNTGWLSKEELTVPLIDQYYFETKDKIEGLCRLLDAEIDGKLIIFCRTKKGVDDLAIALGSRGYMAEGLHGDLSQTQRDRVMKKFRDGTADILIATDVAARGIDIDNITHVINFDIPQDPESYVHRIGRTGRAGNTGVAMTFITPREFRQLKLIERTTKTKITRRQLPTTANVIERQREMIVSKMQSVLDQSNYHDYMPIAASLLKEYDAEDVVAAALKLMQEGNKALEASPEDILAKDLSNTGGRPGMVRLFMNIGRSQKVTVQDIVRTIAIEADIPAKEVGLINIYDKFTFVEVPEDMAEKVLGVMHKNTIKGYKINVEPARVRQ